MSLEYSIFSIHVGVCVKIGKGLASEQFVLLQIMLVGPFF